MHQNVDQLKRLIRMGDRVKKVLRFEWRNCSRVLQGRKKNLWRSKRIPAKDVFDAVYHQNLESEEPWDFVASPVAAPGQGVGTQVGEAGENKDLLRVEYLLDVLAPPQWYQIEVPEAGLDSDGRLERRTVKKQFQLVATSSVKSRPKLMPTVESRDDPVIVKRLALHVQEVAIMPGPEFTDGTLVVYPDSDLRWISYEDLGPWTPVMDSLSVFRDVQGLDRPGCVQLSEPEFARPAHLLTDLKRPTLCMVTESYRRGWNPLRKKTIHKESAIGVMGGREAVKM